MDELRKDFIVDVHLGRAGEVLVLDIPFQDEKNARQFLKGYNSTSMRYIQASEKGGSGCMGLFAEEVHSDNCQFVQRGHLFFNKIVNFSQREGIDLSRTFAAVRRTLSQGKTFPEEATV